MPRIQLQFLFLLACILCGSAGSVFARILHVPTSYPTIQTALDSTAAGDTVLVDRGIYFEHLQIPEHTLALLSHYPFTGDSLDWLDTILDGNHEYSVIRAGGSENYNLIIDGFVVQRGLADDWVHGGDDRSGGVDVRNLAMKIKIHNVLFKDHLGFGFGASVVSLGLQVDLKNLWF